MLLLQQRCDLSQIECHHAQGNVLFKRLPAFPQAAFEPKTTYQPGDDALNAGPEPLQIPEPGCFLQLATLGASIARLDDGHSPDALAVGCFSLSAL